MASAKVLSLTVCILALVASALAVAAAATTYWYKTIGSGIRGGLFQGCIIVLGTIVCTEYSSVPDYVNATRAFVVMGCLFAVVAILLSVLQAGGKLKHRGHVILGVDLLLAFVCLLIGCSVYTAEARKNMLPGEELGFSLWMAWSACVICLVATPIGFLSKRDGYGFM